MLTCRRDRHEEDEDRPQDVADDHRVLVVPSIDEGAGDRAEEQVRQGRHEEGQPLASADPVVTRTTATSASWLSRSPKSEMSCPAHIAEKDPLSASLT